ncbi:hypothetical protein QQ045_020522 [Rhodiola kirilowii]
MEGKQHQLGSVLVTNLSSGVKKGGVDRVEILFREIPDEVIISLIVEGHVLFVAGGFLIERPLIHPCVKGVLGGSDSVMGLSKSLIIEEVSQFCYPSE